MGNGCGVSMRRGLGPNLKIQQCMLKGQRVRLEVQCLSQNGYGKSSVCVWRHARLVSQALAHLHLQRRSANKAQRLIQAEGCQRTGQRHISRNIDIDVASSMSLNAINLYSFCERFCMFKFKCPACTSAKPPTSRSLTASAILRIRATHGTGRFQPVS